MDCQDARAEMLQSFDDDSPEKAQVELHAHLAGCAECGRFAARQAALDARLTAMFTAPSLSSGFRAGLQRRIRRESMPLSPALPDVVHFATCGAATIVCAAVLPFDAAMILGVGAAATSLTYLLMAAVRDWFESAEGTAL
jgi:anti-sigma factor RsiW